VAARDYRRRAAAAAPPLGSLRGRLAALDWLCQGSLFRVPPGAWRWTRKRRGKTVTVAISSPQAQLLRRAIANQRHAERLLSQKKMREISEEIVTGFRPRCAPRGAGENRPKSPLS